MGVNHVSFGQAISSVVGLSIIGAIILPDYTRFIREPSGAVYSAFLSFAIVSSVIEIAGGLCRERAGLNPRVYSVTYRVTGPSIKLSHNSTIYELLKLIITL